MPIDDAVQIVIGGTSYQNWLEVDLDSDLLTPADAWSLTGTIPTSDVRDEFREGAKCDIYIGRDRQMSGVIDEVIYQADRGQARMRLAGRDKGAYLVDNEADPIKAANLTLKQLIDKLLDSSFGIRNVLLSNENNVDLLLGKEEKKSLRRTSPKGVKLKPRVSTKIDPGQTIASILDQHTRRLGIAWWMTAEGDLFIGEPNYDQEIAYHFRCEGVGKRKAVNNNIEQWSVRRSISGRYSEVQVNGMGLPASSDWAQASKSAPKFKGTASDDDLVNRSIVRRLVLRDTDIVNADEATQRAKMEQGLRQLDALTINLTVPDFRDRENARLFTVDTLASVKIEEAGIDGTYYVTQRRFREDRGKRRTELTLKKKGVWLA